MLEINSLTVAYKHRIALQDISLDVTPGEVVALVGPNGAGKSTLIRAASSVIPVLKGNVIWNGKSVLALSHTERARMIAVVPQAAPLGGSFTVEQTVLLGRTPHMGWLGRPGVKDLAAAKDAMQQTCIEHLANRHNAELSGGERQRVLLARALAQETPVLFLDEPTNHLDLQHQTIFLNLVQDLAKQKNLAILMALHDLNLVAQYADRAAFLVSGKLDAIGTPREVLTAGRVSAAYHIPVRVVEHAELDRPLILPGG